METKEITMTKQELRTVENILSKAGATFGDLRQLDGEEWETLTTFSFAKFLAAEPVVVKTLVEAKRLPHANALDSASIDDFIEELSFINSIISILKDKIDTLRCLSIFNECFNEASDEYGSEIYTD